ncbi:MAG TPA: hypothetical protein VLJ41_10140 [Segetibacter sp.]|nr:hypothetical protein [Segetibacter sp.]
MPDEIAKLTANKNASFKVCHLAMKAHHIEMNQIIPVLMTDKNIPKFLPANFNRKLTNGNEKIVQVIHNL